MYSLLNGSICYNFYLSQSMCNSIIEFDFTAYHIMIRTVYSILKFISTEVSKFLSTMIL